MRRFVILLRRALLVAFLRAVGHIQADESNAYGAKEH